MLKYQMGNFNSTKNGQFSFSDLFSFEGRIRRRHYWIISLLSGFVIGLFQTIQQHSDSIGITILFLIIYIFYAWIIFATGAKRCHDLGHNGWWQLIPFYSVWMAFQDGKPGDNEYGPNPKGIGNSASAVSSTPIASTPNLTPSQQQTISSQAPTQIPSAPWHRNTATSARQSTTQTRDNINNLSDKISSKWK